MDFGELSSHRAVSGRTRPGPKPLRARPSISTPHRPSPFATLSRESREARSPPHWPAPRRRPRPGRRRPRSPLRRRVCSTPAALAELLSDGPQTHGADEGRDGVRILGRDSPGDAPTGARDRGHPGIPSPVVRPASRPWPWSWAYPAFPAVRPAEDEFAAGPSEPAFAATFREISGDECAGGGRDLRVRRPCSPSCRSRPRATAFGREGPDDDGGQPPCSRAGGGAAGAAAVHVADDPGDDGSGDHRSRPRAPNGPASHALTPNNLPRRRPRLRQDRRSRARTDRAGARRARLALCEPSSPKSTSARTM